MTKQEWQLHRAEAGPHEPKGCPQCEARKKTMAANARRQERDQLMRDMGLTKVKGAVSGRTYWE